MPKTVVIVDSAGGTDDESLLDLDGEHANKFMKNGLKNNEKVDIKNVQDLSDSNKELYLMKLPKELVKYQKEHGNLKLNLSDVKSGKKFTINNLDYEAVLTKSKVAFNCLCKSNDSFQAINKFKYIIQVNRCIEMPEIMAPEIVHHRVEVPNAVENYLEKKQEIVKKTSSKSLKRALQDEFIELDKTLGKKLKKNKKS